MKADLLGFDIRRRHEDYVQDDWDSARRDLYLLRPGVSAPFSVDPVVWPSVFEYDFPGSVGGITREARLRVAITHSQVRQLALSLWPSNTDMWLTFSSAKVALAGIPVAIYLLRSLPATADEFWDSVLDPPLPESACPPDWLRLGYDIADRDLISGLSNCGYLPSERDELRRRWASRINDHGLFEELHDAELFRQLSDTRVREHSPFFVYGLYRAPAIWEVPSEGVGVQRAV